MYFQDFDFDTSMDFNCSKILWSIFYRVSNFGDLDFSQQYQAFIGFTPK